MRRLKTVTIAVTAANYPEIQTALQAKKDGNPKPTYKLIREGLRSTDQRAAAKNPRPDALQRLIIDIVAKVPAISSNRLLSGFRDLAAEPGKSDVVFEVDETEVHFFEGEHKTGKAKISGLKDRLRRARKTIKAR
jgi:hypothetical protein